MALYTGNHCPVCNEVFTDTDDVVVCPECGTPYHRACWQKVGACVHAAQHSAGFVWTPDKAPDAEGDPAEERVCPNCGAHNAAAARFCDHCGTPLGAQPPRAARNPGNAGPIYTRQQQPEHRTEPGSGGSAAGTARQANFAGIYRRELHPDDTIDGIKAKDWASYVGPSSLLYLAQFVRMDETKRRTSVSLAAFFLGPVYFFYRKMWKQGVLFTLLSLVLLFPTVLLLLQVAGSPLLAGVDLSWLSVANWVLMFVDMAQMILRSLFAFYWYKQTSAKRIRAICEQLPEGKERSDALAMRGGTSVVAVILFFAVVVAASMALYWAMGSGRDAALSLLMRSYIM